MSDKIPWGTLAMWSIDFIRAIRERPIFAKILFRVCIGKHAYREFIGMIDSFQSAGFSPYFGYSLEDMEYHKDKVPLIDWWSEKEFPHETTQNQKMSKNS